jgi:hypothetical protein
MSRSRVTGILAALAIGAVVGGTAHAADDKAAKKASAAEGKTAADAQKATVDMARAAELAQGALAHITAATAALDSDNKDKTQAQSALDAAATSLRQLYTSVPEGEILRELGSNEPGKPLNLAPVLAEMRSRSVWMDPEIVAQVEAANRKMKEGDQQGANEQLMLARQRLAADVALLPIEDAYARVQAARGELKEGHPEQARRLLRNVPLVVSHVQATAPLVPVRFNLRAAATAAEAGDWGKANELVDQASKGLEQVASAPAPKQFDKELKPIVDRLERLNRRLDDGKKPRPKEFRELAKQTRTLAETL